MKHSARRTLAVWLDRCADGLAVTVTAVLLVYALVWLAA